MEEVLSKPKNRVELNWTCSLVVAKNKLIQNFLGKAVLKLSVEDGMILVVYY
jgi:hypothetical protein